MAFLVMMSGLASQGLIFSVTPLLPLLAREFGNDSRGALIAQLVIAMPALGLVGAGMTSGWMAERIGIRRLILGSLIAYGLLGSAAVIISRPWILLSSRVLLGYASGCLSTSGAMLIVRTYEGDARARVLGYQGASSNGTMVVSLIALGAIGQMTGWRIPFGIYAVLSLPIFLCALLSVRDPPPVRLHGSGSGASVLKTLWTVYVVGAGLSLLLTGTTAQLPFVLEANGVMQPSIQSFVLSSLTMAAVVGSVLFGRLQAALGEQRTFVFCLSVIAAGFVCIGLSHGVAVALIGAIAVGAGLGLYLPYLYVLTTRYAAESLQGRALGFLSTTMYLGSFANVFVFGPLRTWIGLGGTFTVLGFVTAVCCVGTALAKRGMLVGKR